MSDEERTAKVRAGLNEHAKKLREFHGTPILCIGVGHAPGTHPGKFIVSMAGGLPLEKAYAIITAMQEDIAARLGVR